MPDLGQNFAVHPLRGRVLSELHARPFAAVETPARILRLGFIVDPERLEAAGKALAQRCERSGLAAPPDDARHAKIDFPEGCFQFERHNEFVTYTWILPGALTPFSPAATAVSVIDWLPGPGLLIVAADVHVLPEHNAPDLHAIFPGSSAACSDVIDGRAVVSTDFRADTQGFVRLMVVDRSLDRTSAAMLVQALLELETYRSLALLGLPEAQSRSPEVEALERELPEIMFEVRKASGVAGNQKLLDRLTTLSAELETSVSLSSFRFGATKAYAQLIEQRLELLRENALPPASTLRSFLGRRFTPAIRTCEAVETRLALLSVKISRVTDLLRTRVEVDLEAQNSELLRQMSDRVRLQTRLQQTVEGLSVAAISYYAAGITHYVLEPLEKSGWHINTSAITALSVPLVAAVVLWTLWRARRTEA